VESKLVFIEGAEGVGKTTLLNMIAFELKSRPSRKPVITCQPYSPRLREGIAAYSHDPVCQALLLTADRRAHMRLLNSVWAGEDVLCDRGPLSTLVYQGLVDGVDLDWLRELNGVAMEGVTVTSTIVLCASFETMVERLKERDAFDPDLQDLDRLRGIWEVYESLKPSKVYPFSYPMGGLLQKWADLTGPVYFVNAEQLAEDVCKDVLSLI